MSDKVSDERLREYAASFNNPDVRALAAELLVLRAQNIRAMSDAASLIESLERERDEQIAGHAAARQNFHLMQVSANELRKRAEAAEAQVSRLTEALARSVTALDDWLNVYASDHCDEGRVIKAWDRIMQYGTIGYIAHVQEANRLALNHTDGDA